MPKYLIQANYSGDGVKGLLKEGGSGRRVAVEKLIESMGGTLETFYYAFGDTDLYAIAELPDEASMAAIALTVSSGAALSNFRTTVLLSPEKVDEAVNKKPVYRAPGQ